MKLVLRSPLGRFTNAIFNAGIRAGRALEREHRWFTDQGHNTREVIGAHKQANAAFEDLYEYIVEQVERHEKETVR